MVRGRPLFEGHYQPHLPGELGFYDLRLPEARERQAELALDAGIEGFCYYHYWFNGRRILERPVDAMLASGSPDLPFCLAWANENWTRTWDGKESNVLLEQNYSAEDDFAHIEHLAPYLADRRYIRVHGRPLLIVYKVDALPEPARTFDRWRQRALELGIGELCLARFEALGPGLSPNPTEVGLDLSIEFAPDWRNLGGRYHSTPKARLAMRLGLLSTAYRDHKVYDYQLMIDRILDKPTPIYPFVRCVSPGFDNSPRRPTRGAVILKGSTPSRYETWLDKALQWSAERGKETDGLLFINAWNEWAEGNHLEPDAAHGRAYIDATRRARDRAGSRLPDDAGRSR